MESNQAEISPELSSRPKAKQLTHNQRLLLLHFVLEAFEDGVLKAIINDSDAKLEKKIVSKSSSDDDA